MDGGRGGTHRCPPAGSNDLAPSPSVDPPTPRAPNPWNSFVGRSAFRMPRAQSSYALRSPRTPPPAPAASLSTPAPPHGSRPPRHSDPTALRGDPLLAEPGRSRFGSGEMADRLISESQQRGAYPRADGDQRDTKGARPTIGGKRTLLLNCIPSAYERWGSGNALTGGLVGPHTATLLNTKPRAVSM